MKLYQEIFERGNRKHIEPTWGSMDPEDQPNPLTPDPKPKNYLNK